MSFVRSWVSISPWFPAVPGLAALGRTTERVEYVQVG